MSSAYAKKAWSLPTKFPKSFTKRLNNRRLKIEPWCTLDIVPVRKKLQSFTETKCLLSEIYIRISLQALQEKLNLSCTMLIIFLLFLLTFHFHFMLTIFNANKNIARLQQRKNRTHRKFKNENLNFYYL